MKHLSLSALLLGRIRNSQNEVDDDREEEDDSEEGRSESIIETSLPSQTNRLRAPVICEQRIHHGSHCDDGEEEGGDEGGPVTEVQHANGKSSENDSEVQP
jgi:hypothetical protein